MPEKRAIDATRLHVGEVWTWEGERLAELGLIPDGSKQAPRIMRVTAIYGDTITVDVRPTDA